MPLTEVGCRSAKPTDKPRKRSKGGLILLIQPNGTKHRRWNYRFEGRPKTAAFGV